VDTSGTMFVEAGQPTAGGDTCQNATSVTTDYTTGVLRPSGVALDAAGDLFVADTGHNCVRRLNAGGSGIASLLPLVGTCAEPSTTSVAPAPAGLALDAAGNLYIAINDAADGIYQVLRSSPSNYASVCLLSGAASAAVPTPCPGLLPPAVVLNAPQGLAIDPVGNLYIADSGNACVREISGNLPSTALGKCTNDGTGSSITALQTPVSVTSDAVGHLYVDDNGAGKVYEMLSGQLALVAGNGGSGTYNSTQEGKAAVSNALLNPHGLAADKAGNVYVADTNNNIVRILSQGLGFPQTGVGNKSVAQNLWFMITAAVKPAVNSMASRLTVLKPVKLNVNAYDPGRRPTMSYRPSASVTTVRTFSMSTGLAASTVTPGRTAPDVSLTTPAMAAACCAETADESARFNPTTTTATAPQRFIGRLRVLIHDS